MWSAHMRLAAALTALALFVTPALAREPGHGISSHGFYQSTDGRMVHGPTRTASPAYGRISATCRDGTQSYSHHHRGTCSGHGGVGVWR
ncbi:DUF3761 domain-containing protein [Acidisphaera sp. L21]|uniref:DUF3761 domain-containing protein n=1 Tax=Acidisphaera sp. L21 TaxID=1641851 RepID=UPI00131E9A69